MLVQKIPTHIFGEVMLRLAPNDQIANLEYTQARCKPYKFFFGKKYKTKRKCASDVENN